MTRPLLAAACLAAALAGVTSPLPAQEIAVSPGETPLGIVDTIIVSGNEKTKTYVILDEMTLKPGSTVTQGAITYDRNRIYSLGLFTKVDVFFDSLGTQRFLFVDVRERWYIIPVPILGFRDGDPKKIYYGAGLLHTNFRGRNQKLYGSAVFGFDPAFSFSFADPLFDRESSTYIATSVSTANVRNRSEVEASLTGDFDERHVDLSGTLGKRFGLFETADISPGVHYVKVSIYRQGRTADPDGTDLYLYATASYNHDTRDLREYSMRGSLAHFYFTKNGFGESAVNFSRFGFDLRTFIPLVTDFSLGFRGHASLVSGSTIPTYARAYYGSSERIRGYYHTVWEGEDLAGGTVELRYLVYDPRTFVFSAIPMPVEFSVWRFGVGLALFCDFGAAWYRHDELQLASFGSGYGAGINFLLPYGAVLRVEYAWDNYGRGQFIVDLRTSI